MSEPQTIRDVLLASLPSEPHIGEGKRALEIPDMPEFRLRSDAASTQAQLDHFKKELKSSTHLYPPKQFFSGPKVSQPLLQLHDIAPIRKTYPFEQHHYLTCEAVPHHAGQYLDEYISRADNLKRFMQACIDSPEILEEIYEQAAFVGLQSPPFSMGDLGPHNMRIVTPRGDRPFALSLIDLVNDEAFDGADEQLGTPQQQQKQAKDFVYSCQEDAHNTPRTHWTIEKLATSLRENEIDVERPYGIHGRLIHEVLTFGRRNGTAIGRPILKSDPALCQTYLDTLNDVYDKTMQKIEHGTLGQDRPWHGFRDGEEVTAAIAKDVNTQAGEAVFEAVDGVQAVRLDAPAHTLKLALQALYAQAVPEHAGGRA